MPSSSCGNDQRCVNVPGTKRCNCISPRQTLNDNGQCESKLIDLYIYF